MGWRRSPDAVAWHRKALELRERRFGPHHPRVAQSLSAIGRILKSIDLEGAMAALDRALPLQRRAFGERSVPVALTLERIAAVRLRQGRSDEALELLQLATSILREHAGWAQYDASIVWSRLGSALSAVGRHAEALEAHHEAYSRFERSFGPKHPRLALPATNYAYAAQRGRPHARGRGLVRAWHRATAPSPQPRRAARAISDGPGAGHLGHRRRSTACRRRSTNGPARVPRRRWIRRAEPRSDRDVASAITSSSCRLHPRFWLERCSHRCTSP